MVFNSVQLSGGSNNTVNKAWKEGKMQYLQKPKPFTKTDTTMYRWLNPDPDPNIKIDRPQLPPDEVPKGSDAAAGGGG